MPLLQLPAWAAQAGVFGMGVLSLWLVQAVILWRKQDLDERTAETSAGLQIKKHRDGLTIQMLEMARSELRAAHAEITGLRSELEQHIEELSRLKRIEWRLAAYEEAITHIETLLKAEINGGREAAEHAAQVFLARMEAMKLKLGEEAQAEQRDRAAKKLLDGDDQ